MLNYYNFDIVFAEIPDEVTLAINISGCPNHCKGCHSPWLQKEVGPALNEGVIDALMNRYGQQITCFCFMGGDAQPQEVERLAHYIRGRYSSINVAWYSGKPKLCEGIGTEAFQYIKIGPYLSEYGQLNKRTTN